MQLTLTAPLPPSLNNAYATVRGRRVLVSEGRDYKAMIGQLLALSPEARQFAQALGGQRLALTLRLWFEDRRRTDISNRIKLLEDALAKNLGFDDCAVDALLVVRAGYDKSNPRCEVVLEIIEKEQ